MVIRREGGGGLVELNLAERTLSPRRAIMTLAITITHFINTLRKVVLLQRSTPNEIIMIQPIFKI